MADRDSTRDPGLTALLERVADSGAAAARPAPAAQLRRTAETRTTRRRLAAASLALVIAVVGGAAVLAGGESIRTAPPPAGGSSPAPTQLGQPDAGYRHRGFGQEMLVTSSDAGVLGGTWSSAPGLVRGRDLLTPCQTAPAPRPAGSAAMATALSTGATGATVVHLIDSLPDADAASAAYHQIVGWFADCADGVDESDARTSVVRRAAALRPVPGVDDMRILVIRRDSSGPDNWVGTVAAVTRVDNLVSVLAWDLVVDDDPPALDDGFVALTRQTASRLTGGDPRHVAIPDAALLTVDDPAVVSALGAVGSASELSLVKVPWMDPLCNHAYTEPATGTAEARTPQIIGQDASAVLIEFVTRYDSASSAQAAVAGATATADRCPDADLLDGTRQPLDLTVPDAVAAAGWGATYDDPGVGTTTRFRGLAQHGDLVAYVLLDSGNTVVTADTAAGVVEAAAERLASAG